jgi:MSHA biogenesis protein MshM
MYLEFFGLQRLPFSLTPDTGSFCNLPHHAEVFNTLLFSIQNQEPFIKVVGEVGTGKTLLCRMLLNSLDDQYYTAYLPNPDLSPDGLCKALAVELGVDIQNDCDQHVLRTQLNSKLLELNEKEKHVVFIVDEAQALSEESLETLRLLTNFETESKKLMQVVLFGQPELDFKINQPRLRQLLQRITFSCKLGSIDREFMRRYICHRLISVGHPHGDIFTDKALHELYRNSKGIPRLINILCHKSMLIAFSRKSPRIDKRIMKETVASSRENIVSHTGHRSYLQKLESRSINLLSTCVWTLCIASVVYSVYIFIR